MSHSVPRMLQLTSHPSQLAQCISHSATRTTQLLLHMKHSTSRTLPLAFRNLYSNVALRILHSISRIPYLTLHNLISHSASHNPHPAIRNSQLAFCISHSASHTLPLTLCISHSASHTATLILHMKHISHSTSHTLRNSNEPWGPYLAEFRDFEILTNRRGLIWGIAASNAPFRSNKAM